MMMLAVAVVLAWCAASSFLFFAVHDVFFVFC